MRADRERATSRIAAHVRRPGGERTLDRLRKLVPLVHARSSPPNDTDVQRPGPSASEGQGLCTVELGGLRLVIENRRRHKVFKSLLGSSQSRDRLDRWVVLEFHFQ